MQNKKGFTLIELLVVIAIIGILSSTVIASLNNARMKARDARRVSDLSQIRLAMELFQDSSPTRSYPITLTSVGVSDYITVPNDPITGNAYSYVAICSVASLLNPIGYHLGATLESKSAVLGGDDDYNSTAGTTYCTGGDQAGFDGAVEDDNTKVYVYDLKQ